MKERKKRSIIWTLASEDFNGLIKGSKSRIEVLKKLGFTRKRGSYGILNKRIKADGIDCSHFDDKYDRVAVMSRKRKKDLKDVLVEGSTYSRYNLKKRLLENKMLKNECSICGQVGEWNGKLLVMVLDHINGINNDNHLENLRMLCPNCNSQQETFSGKNIRVKRKEYFCEKCGKIVSYKRKLCNKCRGVKGRVVKDRPSKEELKVMVENFGFSKVGRDFCVSGNTIKKWLI